MLFHQPINKPKPVENNEQMIKKMKSAIEKKRTIVKKIRPSSGCGCRKRK